MATSMSNDPLVSDISLQTQPRANLDCFWAYAEQIIFTATILHMTESGDAENISSLAAYMKSRTPDKLSTEIANSPNEDARKMWIVYSHCDARLAATMLSGIREQLESLHKSNSQQRCETAERRSPLWLILCVVQLPNTIARAVAMARSKPEILGCRRTDFQLWPSNSGGSKRIAA